ncbi:TPA: hypothetical protein ACH3X2_007495 [Trebouxia sp. C0005]
MRIHRWRQFKFASRQMRQQAGVKLSVTDAALVSGFVALKMTGLFPEALLQVAKNLVTLKIVKDAAKQAEKAAMLENHYSSQQESLTASLTVVHHSLGQLREGAANTAGRFKELQVQMDARQAQHEQKMIMHAQQLAARELHLVQQQARLTRKEAELHECQTAFQERVTAYSTTHSRLNGATSGCCSFAAGAAHPNPVLNPLWSPDSALPSTLHYQAVEDVLARDRRIVALPLDIPKTQSHALQPCKVQVIINEIFGVQPEAESQMWPVVRSADRHAELGAVAASPPIHASSLQSPGEFHTARAHLVAHGIMAVASSSSLCSTSCWSSSSCDSLMAGGHHKVVSDRSASDESESNCSAREPSSVDIRHEVPSVSLVRPQVVFTPKAQQVTALAGPTVKSASTAEDFSKRTATMSTRQMTPSPKPLGLSSPGICSTSSGDCNTGKVKRGGIKGAPAYKAAGKISIRDNKKPSACELHIPTAMLSSSDFQGTCFPKQRALHQRQPS